MRIMRALFVVMAVTAAAWLAGCGGGGGGTTPPNPSNGTVTVDTLMQEVVYTPPASRSTNTVYAYFQPTTGGQTVSALFEYDAFANRWTLDISPASTQFNGQAVGDYNMSVWVIFTDSESPAKIGNTILIPDLNILGDSGPPPPPWP